MRGPLRSLLCCLAAAGLCAGMGLAADPPADELAAKARRGKEAMGAGRFGEAAGLYAEIVRALPNEPGMLLNLGMALSMAGRAPEAIPHLQAALKLRPDLLPASLFLGSAYMEMGQPSRAVAPLQSVVAAQPDNRDARQMLADALLSTERYEPALRHYRKLAEAAPQDPRAWYGLGRSYEGLAQEPFVDLQRNAPESPYLLLLVAHAMASEGKVANAFRLYREALDKRPDFAEAREAVARIYEQKGQPAWAASEREKARAVPSPDCRSPSLECDFRAGRYEAIVAAAKPLATSEAGRYWRSRAADELARAAFARLGQLPASPEALLVKVQVLRGQRQPPGELILEMKKAVGTWPEDLRLRRELANLLYLVHDLEGARALLLDLVKREPESVDLALQLGMTWLEAQQAAQALPLFEKAVRLEPKRLRAQALLGRAQLEAGHAAEAVVHLELARETDTDGSLHYQLARAYRATGQAERASAALRKFQEIQAAAAAETESLKEEFQITPPS